MQEDLGASVILVGHDMGLMAQFVDRLGVMYAGKLVEVSPVRDIFREAAAPVYADAHRQPAVAGAEGRLPGHPRVSRRCCWTCPPAARSIPAARWPMDRCRTEAPLFREAPSGAWAACHLV